MSKQNYASQAQRLDRWQEVLTREPDLMVGLIQDVLKIVQSQGDSERVGRRPAAQAMHYEDMWSELFPERYSSKPASESLRDLMAPLTQGQFAMKVPCSQAALSWILSGKRQPSIEMLEALARAGNVTPAFFREWRAWRISSLVTAALVDSPDMTTAIAKSLSRRAG